MNLTDTKITEIFYLADEFCKEFDARTHRGGAHQPGHDQDQPGSAGDGGCRGQVVQSQGAADSQVRRPGAGCRVRSGPGRHAYGMHMGIKL